MMHRVPPQTDAQLIAGFLTQHSFSEALTHAQAWRERAPRDVHAHAAVVQSLLPLGRLAATAEAADRGLILSPVDPTLNLLRAVIDHRLGRTDAAVKRLTALLSRAPANEIDATITLAEVLQRSGRSTEVAALIAKGGAWLADERAQVCVARATARMDRDAGCAQLEATAHGTGNAQLKRIAGFEAVRLHDAAGRYREAFALATTLHRETTPTFDIGEVEMDVAEQLRLMPRLRAVNRTAVDALGAEAAFVIGLPRSGTTLLEQMLDRHPSICGIGEFEGAFAIRETLTGLGVWPSNLRALAASDAARLAGEYLSAATDLRRAGARVTFDKTLHGWRMLPALAAVLPNAAFVHLCRSPRDTAISMFLSNFHPRAWGFTRELSMIRRIIALERSLVKPMFDALGVKSVSIVYEELVDHPEREIRRALEVIGVAFDAAVLTPEQNTRTVLTLSHEQVRRSINRSSIGRWKNYEFAFDSEWDSLS